MLIRINNRKMHKIFKRDLQKKKKPDNNSRKHRNNYNDKSLYSKLPNNWKFKKRQILKNNQKCL